MLETDIKTFDSALAAFDFTGEVVKVSLFGNGHVNNTFRIQTKTNEGECKKYTLQRLSDQAFKNPAQLMENICNVTDYLRRIIIANNGDIERETLTVIKTINGENYFTDEDGRAWRMYKYIDNATTPERADTPEQFYTSGKAFGNFQRLLSDYPADTLHETIVDFHNTIKRLENLKKAVSEDRFSRAHLVSKEVQFAFERENDCALALKALYDGILPLRVTHNDTKLNNVLMDDASGEWLCIIDLDTVMPGLSVYDFGDSIRFGANNASEDEQDLEKVNFDLSLYEIYAKGYIEGCGGTLTQAELDYMPLGAKLITLECGMRFLTDYLEGDVYFNTSRPDQNLDRARTQFKLVRDMESVWQEMHDIINKLR